MNNDGWKIPFYLIFTAIGLAVVYFLSQIAYHLGNI